MPWGLTPAHLIILLVIVLIIVGPGKLPDTGAAIGKALRGFKDSMDGVEPGQTAAAQPPAAPVAPAVPVAPGQPVQPVQYVQVPAQPGVQYVQVPVQPGMQIVQVPIQPGATPVADATLAQPAAGEPPTQS
jgi:sec-independent protein translocase protein TatA